MDVAVDTAQAHRLNHFCHLLFKVRFSKESELTVRGITRKRAVRAGCQDNKSVIQG
jgi:hypothetical protein